MLELTPKPQFSVVVPPKLLQEGYLVHFPGDWPSTMTALREKTFRINAVNTFRYDLPYILPTGDFRDVDFSNGDGTFQESIYPEKYETLLETLVGFKPGNFITYWEIPSGKNISSLEYAQMYPDRTDSKRRYLGIKTADDSPYDDPRIKLYFVKDLTPLIMRIYIPPGVDYEKVVVGLTLNKCLMKEIENPTDEQMQKAKVIRYYDYLRW